MGRNGRRAVQDRFTWDTITDQMLVIYQGLCPSRVMLPRRAADKVPSALVESSRETSWAGAVAENALVTIAQDGAHGPRISVQARRHIGAADTDEQADDTLTAIKRCNQHRQRFRIHDKQQPGIKRMAVPWEVPADDLVLAAPEDVLMAHA
jgi:hypothetical protein